MSEAGHADEWPPTHLDEERMGAAEFSSAADVLASCARRDHAEFLVLLEVLAAMAAHGITEQKFKLSALFGCQFVAESPSPFFPLDENLAPSGESPRSSAQRDAREHLVVKLIGCNDLDTSLRVAGALGHNQQKVRLQFVLRAYEMGDESSLAAEATALIEDRYKLGVGLLTVSRQRLARVLLAAQDRAEALQMERERAGRDGDGDRDERRAKLQLSEQEKKEQELLGLMQTKLALKQVRTMHSMILHCSTRGFVSGCSRRARRTTAAASRCSRSGTPSSSSSMHSTCLRRNPNLRRLCFLARSDVRLGCRRGTQTSLRRTWKRRPRRTQSCLSMRLL